MPYGEGNGGEPEVDLGDLLTTVSEYLNVFALKNTPYQGRVRVGDLSGEATLAAPEDPALPMFKAGARAFPDQPGGGEAYYGVEAGPFQYNRAFTKFLGGTGVRDTVSAQVGKVGLSYEEAQQRIEEAREKLPGRRTLSAHLGLGPFGARVGRTWTEENLDSGWRPPPMTTAEARWNKGPLSLSGMVADQRGVPGLANYGGRVGYRMNDPFGLGGNLALGAGVRRGREKPEIYGRVGYGLNF
jgi:hypothetical protein